MDAIKIYGMRRSGTNYFKWLIEHNFEAIVVAKDKHNKPYTSNDWKAYVMVVKNPYSWVVSSIKHNDYKKLKFPRRIKLWNYDNRVFLDFILKHQGFVIRYETLISKPFEILEEIRRFTGIRKTMAEYVLPKGMVTTAQTISKTPFIKDYYLNEQYFKALTAEQVRIITNKVDKELLTGLGYESL